MSVDSNLTFEPLQTNRTSVSVFCRCVAASLALDGEEHAQLSDASTPDNATPMRSSAQRREKRKTMPHDEKNDLADAGAPTSLSKRGNTVSRNNAGDDVQLKDVPPPSPSRDDSVRILILPIIPHFEKQYLTCCILQPFCRGDWPEEELQDGVLELMKDAEKAGEDGGGTLLAQFRQQFNGGRLISELVTPAVRQAIAATAKEWRITSNANRDVPKRLNQKLPTPPANVNLTKPGERRPNKDTNIIRYICKLLSQFQRQKKESEK
jgi:hypothetical protein